MLSPTFQLAITLDQVTGQVLSLRDPESGCLIHQAHAGSELKWNGLPLTTRLVSLEEGRSEHITTMEALVDGGYGCGATLVIRRVLSLGGAGLHSGPSGSLHMRYEIRRARHQGSGDPIDYIWNPPIEMPLRLDHLTVLAAPTPRLGVGTRLRALALGGTGPREHVSLEEGPAETVLPFLSSGFRSAFPGQPTINGVLMRPAEGNAFVWLIARRPTTAGMVEADAQHQAFRFSYFRDFPVEEEITTPTVSWFWGRGDDAADRVLARQFDRFMDPPPWFAHSTWFWLHPGWIRDGSFAAAKEGAMRLMDAGVTGFGLFAHDVPWAGHDCDINSPMPMPSHGGDDGLRGLVQAIKDRGGHTYVWISRNAHRADSLDYRESWGVRGIDGRTIRIRNRPDSGVRIDVVNPADPTFESYIASWIEHYVRRIGIDGLFWDSGFQAIPADFGKDYLRWPGEAAARVPHFYERIYRFGKSLSPDFFMWAEGISCDVPMNAYSVDSRTHGLHSGHRLMHRLNRLGDKRLVWRSAWSHDLASGFPFISPVNDIGFPAGPARYEQVAADPLNRFVCDLVRREGLRHAEGLGDGISRLGQILVRSPGRDVATSVVLPAAQVPSGVLTSCIGGMEVRGALQGEALHFELPDAGAWQMT